ncbi:MAG: hypothetical protein KGH88_06275 [Thaumarchaeota archaeon]|nr:hypothetical protein [Nitrososphaerota archaeon]
MEKTSSGCYTTFARKVLIPHWFEITSGIVVGFGMVLIFAERISVS